MKYYLILLCCFFIIVSGCAVPYRAKIKDGKTYCTTRGVFKSKWYNYFERSLSCIEGEYFKEALYDLNIAIKQRVKDQRMARTFGMHFIDYFPHREKGLVHFLMGDYEFAEFEFNLSIEQEPSAKAFYYLDEIRKIKLKQNKHLKSTGPKILIDKHLYENENKNIILTKSFPIIISGSITDPFYVSSLLISNKAHLIDRSSKKIRFSKNLYLSNGKHQVDIIAENLKGEQSNLQLIVIVDSAGPVISIKSINSYSEITGSLKDESGLSSLFINDKKVDIPDGKYFNFKASKLDISKELTIIANDVLGNKSEIILKKKAIDKLFKNYLTSNAMLNIASDAESILKKPDKLTPEIIFDDLKDHNISYVKMVNIRGRVESKSQIKSLIINSDLIPITSGLFVSFDYPLLLQNGENKINIKAKDGSDHVLERNIVIIKKIPSHYNYNERYKIAAHDFSNMYWFEEPGLLYYLYSNIIKGSNKKRITGDFVRDVFNAHAKKRNRFYIIDRNIFEPSHASLFGKIRITRVGIELSARLIDNKTSEVLANKGVVKDVYYPKKSLSEIKSMIKELYEKFHKEFPVAHGEILELQGKSFLCSLNNDQIRMNWPIIIYNETKLDNNLGYQTNIISQAIISGETKIGYEAICNNSNFIKSGYKIITR